jgi:DNA-binding MarR family transcriptional regulator
MTSSVEASSSYPDTAHAQDQAPSSSGESLSVVDSQQYTTEAAEASLSGVPEDLQEFLGLSDEDQPDEGEETMITPASEEDSEDGQEANNRAETTFNSRGYAFNFAFRVGGSPFFKSYSEKRFIEFSPHTKLLLAIGQASTFRHKSGGYMNYLTRMVNRGSTEDQAFPEDEVYGLLSDLTDGGYTSFEEGKYELIQEGYDQLIGKKRDIEQDNTALEGDMTTGDNVPIETPPELIQPLPLPRIKRPDGRIVLDVELHELNKGAASQEIQGLNYAKQASSKRLTLKGEIAKRIGGNGDPKTYRSYVTILEDKGFVKVNPDNTAVSLTEEGIKLIALLKTYSDDLSEEPRPFVEIPPNIVDKVAIADSEELLVACVELHTALGRKELAGILGRIYASEVLLELSPEKFARAKQELEDIFNQLRQEYVAARK